MAESKSEEECSNCSEYGSQYYCWGCRRFHCDICLKKTDRTIDHSLEYLEIPCANHDVDNLCKHFCELCDKPVCQNCILKHIGEKHSLIRLQDAIEKKIDIIQDHKKILSSEIEERRRELNGLSKNENVSCDRFLNAVEKELIEKVKNSISKMRESAKKNLLNSTEKIAKRKQQLDSAIQELELKMKEFNKMACEDILAFNDDKWRTTCFGKKFTSFAIIDDFVKNMISKELSELEDVIGKVFQETYDKFYPEGVMREKQMLKTIQAKEINTEVEFLMDIVCASKGVMICSAQNNSSLFRIEHKRKSVLPCLGFNPEYIAMLPSSGVLLFTSLNELFKSPIAGNMEPEKLFSIDPLWNINGLSISDTDKVYLCLTNETERHGTVVRLNMKGEVMGEYFQNNKGDNLFVNPIYITENKVRDCDICVSDNYSEVRCIKQNKEKRFVYKGTGNADLNLRGIDCDCSGNVIVSDFKNNNLHIINKRGKCIRIIGQDIFCKPTGLCVDLKGDIWVTEYESGRVKVIVFDSSFAYDQ